MIATINTPRINSNDDKVEVVQWHVESGTFAEAGQDVVDIETSKAVVTVTAETAGFVRCGAERGAVVHVGAPLFYCATSREELDSAAIATLPVGGKSSPASPIPSRQDGASRGTYSGTRFSKQATRLMQERGLAPADFEGAGLVTARALDKSQRSTNRERPRRQAPSTPQEESDFSPGPKTPRSDRVSLAKQAEIQSLSIGESGNINSMLSVYFDSAAIRARLQNDKAFDGQIQPLILYEISRLLKQWPQFTAYFEDDHIHYYDRIDLGVAIDLGKGLKVVTLKEADKLMPIDMFEKTIDFGLRYLENRIRSDELVDSTLTITDLSGFDVLHFHPLINGRQSAIVGVGGDSTQPGHPMSINMTFDHRVTNGREVATFLKELRTRLLSYAWLDAPTASIPIESQAAAANHPVDAANRCDTCGVDAAAYYRDCGRNAYLMAYFREDGTLGRVCHRCQAGWA